MQLIWPLVASAVLQTPAYAQTPLQAQSPGVDAARRVAATMELAAQEYRLAWVGDSIANTAEWEEARLFVAEARRSVAGLPPVARTEIAPRIEDVERRLAARMPPDSLAAIARDIALRLGTLLGVSLDERPAREPSFANGELLYASTCARCHGLAGRGDGPVALSERMNPAPTNLGDTTLLAGTMPLDLYRRTTLGVPGTRMPPYGEVLSREERWDVVSYILSFRDPTARAGRSGQLAVVFGTVRGALVGAVELAERGEKDAASAKVLDAYMAFEAVEGSLSASSPKIVSRAEERFSAMRMAVASGAAAEELARARADLNASLVEAELALTESHSSAGLFIQSLLLLLREGFEAILVIGAIMAVLVKAGATDQQRHVRLGIAAALLASVITAAAMEMIFRVTPSQREALEGGIMLVAAAVLFYASYWLISKVEIMAWTRFVKGQIQRAVASGSGIGLASIAFLAVYREGFETVLFYKALYVAGGGAGTAPITAGIVAGLVVLVAVFIGIERFGLKIPMRPFFAATGATLAFMAFVFAGEGVKELQEGGHISSTLLTWAPRNSFLGIYPTLESLAVQGVILLALLVALVWTFVIAPRRPQSEGPAGSVTAPIGRSARKTEARKSVG